MSSPRVAYALFAFAVLWPVNQGYGAEEDRQPARDRAYTGRVEWHAPETGRPLPREPGTSEPEARARSRAPAATSPDLSHRPVPPVPGARPHVAPPPRGNWLVPEGAPAEDEEPEKASGWGWLADRIEQAEVGEERGEGDHPDAPPYARVRSREMWMEEAEPRAVGDDLLSSVLTPPVPAGELEQRTLNGWNLQENLAVHVAPDERPADHYAPGGLTGVRSAPASEPAPMPRTAALLGAIMEPLSRPAAAGVTGLVSPPRTADSTDLPGSFHLGGMAPGPIELPGVVEPGRSFGMETSSSAGVTPSYGRAYGEHGRGTFFPGAFPAVSRNADLTEQPYQPVRPEQPWSGARGLK